MGQHEQFVANATSIPAREFAPASGWYRSWGKRVFDISFAILTAPLTVSITLVLALLVALDGSAPFFRQRRLGRNGEIFTMWKLRSMRPGAARVLQNVLATDPARRAEWQKYQKLANDPRVTPVGRFLRSTSLDELPQFWNVLRGDMSVVGPRPILPEQRSFYPGEAYERLRPGITGPWQVSERNGSEFATRARYDEAYLRGFSLPGDLRVCFQTFFAMLRATGR